MVKYITKPNEWFKANTEAILIDDYRSGPSPDFNMGLFEGIRICENPLSEGQWHEIGDEYIDQEVCGFDEFDIVED